MLGPCLAALVLAGCFAPRPVTPAPAPSATSRLVRVAEGGRVRLEVRPRPAVRALLALREPFSAADVARLVVSLHRQPAEASAPPIAALTLTPATGLTAPLTFEGLRPWTGYVIRGAAYDGADTLISDPQRSEVTVAVTNDEAPPPVGLPVALVDRPFAATVALPAVTLTPGATRPGYRGVVSWLAGQGGVLAEEGLNRLGKEQPEGGLAIAPDGTLYVADTELHRIKRIAPDGRGVTVAGSRDGSFGLADGSGLAARFNTPKDLALAPDGSVVVVDTNNHRLCRVAADGTVTTLAGGTQGYADGTGPAAAFNGPAGVAVGADGVVYVGDTGNHCIRKVTPEGVVSTLAGGNASGFTDATGADARFSGPSGLAVAADGTLYVADTGNHRIRRITARGVVTTLAGSGVAGFLNGTGTGARFSSPRDLDLDASGTVYVADTNTRRIRMVTAAGVVTTLAGAGSSGFLDGTATTAQFMAPTGLVRATDGTLRVFDRTGVRAVVGDQVLTVLPNGIGTLDGAPGTARFHHPYGITVAPDGVVFVADNYNGLIRQIARDGAVTTLAGSTTGYRDGTGSAAMFNFPDGIALGPDGALYVGDRNNHRIRKVTRTGVVTTVAGAGTAGTADGAAGVAQFNTPRGVAVASDGTIYVADSNNHRIRRVTPAGEVSTLAGSAQGFADGVGTGAMLSGAWGIALAGDDTLYVADSQNHRIRRVSTVDGKVETLAGDGLPGWLDGPGASARFNTPAAITVGADGSLYVAEGGSPCSSVRSACAGSSDDQRFVAVEGSQRIRRVTLDGITTTVAGGTMGFANGTGAAARFNHPRGLALAPDGSLLIADRMNHCVRVLR